MKNNQQTSTVPTISFIHLNSILHARNYSPDTGDHKTGKDAHFHGVFILFGRQMVTQYPHKTISNGRCNEGKEYYNSNIYEAMAEELKVNKKE